MRFAFCVALCFILAVFAGCTDEQTVDGTEETENEPTSAAAPGRIEGTVHNEEGPVEDASVAIVRLGLDTRTAADGTFTFDEVTPGSHALQVDAEHHHRVYEDLVVRSGETTRTELTIELTLLAPGVPTRDGFVESPIVASDAAVVSIGDQAPRLVVTNGTVPDPEGNASRPGWWTVPPHDEGHAAFFVVTLSWNASSTPVALRVAHGDPQNEPTDVVNSTQAPSEPEPFLEGQNFRHYRFENPDVAALGKQPWHFGVYAAPNETDLPVTAERFVDHTIVVQVVYLVDEAVEAQD